MLYVYRFYYLSTWGGCWFVVFIRRYIYKFSNVCPCDYTAVAGNVKVGPVNQVNHTSGVAVVTPTDRPKSVRNRCVIELFVALFVLSFCPFDISVGVWAFVIGLSQISSFFYHVLFSEYLKNQVSKTGVYAKVMEPGAREGKRFLLVWYTPRKCVMETSFIR